MIQNDQERLDSYNRTAQPIRDEINSRRLSDFIHLDTDKTGKECCPICGSGTGKKGTTAFKQYPNGICYCGKGCFDYKDSTGSIKKGQGTLGALRTIWGCSERDAFAKAGYSIQDEKSTQTVQEKPIKKEGARVPQEAQNRDYSKQYKEWNDYLLQGNNEGYRYLISRGITEDSMKAFNLGYCPTWEKCGYRKKKVIIPRSNSSYLARSIDKNHDTYEKQIEGSQKELFNSVVLEDSEAEQHGYLASDPILVVEGELDAISIIQAGYIRVLGLGSISNDSIAAKTIQDRNPTGCYILALDNDPPKEKRNGKTGQEAQENIHRALDEAGIVNISVDTNALYNGLKDANDAYKENPEGLLYRIQNCAQEVFLMNQAKKEEEAKAAEKTSGTGMVDSFLLNVQTDLFKPVTTCFRCVDRALNGGFRRQSIVMLGGSPGIGKTAFITQMVEGMATGNRDMYGDVMDPQDILYINLEMSTEQLLARSLARIASRSEIGTGLDVTKIMEGYRWTADERDRVYRIADVYKRTVAKHLIYNPVPATEDEQKNPTDLEVILAKIEREKNRLGHSPSVIVIDYLQLISTRDVKGNREAPVDTIKKAVDKLKALAIKNDCIVICITANNRESNKSGESDITSGRDTSAIEYSADVHMGLVYTSILKKEKSLDDIRDLKRRHYNQDETAKVEYNMHCTGITLKVNKNRFGQDETAAYLHFDGAAMAFTEGTGLQEQEPTKIVDITRNSKEKLPWEK